MVLKNVLKCLGMATIIGFASCSDDETAMAGTQQLNLEISGLEDLGAAFQYEGWIIVDGAPVSTGTFTVDADGNTSDNAFQVSEEDAAAATKFVISVEPIPDTDPAPSAVKVLAGDFSGDAATLSVSDPAALGTNFESATGKYIIATATDGNADMNELSGVWFLDNSSGSAEAGLDLPTLPAGWAYEGWAVVDGTPLSTGTFTSVSGSDNSGIYNGTVAGPPFPGEDFLNNAPDGITFPLSLSSRTVVISVEPVPDNSPAPFVLKPLVGQVPANVQIHTALDMSNNAVATNPTGTVSK